MADRLADLEALRGLLWESIREVDANERSPLAGRLESVIAQIAELQPATEKVGDPVDEIAARRASRRSGASAG